MPIADHFPRELLDQPKAARLTYFRSYTVAHPLLKEVDAQLWQVVQSPGDATLVCLYGPTGVGKTTILRRLEQRLLEQGRLEMEQDPNFLPVAGLAAVAPDGGNFNWPDYYKRALEALDDPFLGRAEAWLYRGSGTRWSAPEMRRTLERAIRSRRVAAFIIDEAQHLTKMSSGRKLQDQMDCIKSLSSATGALHVLAGTYELLAFRNLSAQLVRRSVDIHFRRYKVEVEEEVKAWQGIVWALQRHLPLREEPDLVSRWEFCFERSLGCVGVLKQWLVLALQAALDEERHTIGIRELEKRALTIMQCEKMAGEMLEGEGQLEENKPSSARLRSLLNLQDSSALDTSETAKKKYPGGRVGQRKPQRDLVGRRQRAG